MERLKIKNRFGVDNPESRYFMVSALLLCLRLVHGSCRHDKPSLDKSHPCDQNGPSRPF